MQHNRAMDGNFSGSEEYLLNLEAVKRLINRSPCRALARPLDIHRSCATMTSSFSDHGSHPWIVLIAISGKSAARTQDWRQSTSYLEWAYPSSGSKAVSSSCCQTVQIYFLFYHKAFFAFMPTLTQKLPGAIPFFVKGFSRLSGKLWSVVC